MKLILNLLAVVAIGAAAFFSYSNLQKAKTLNEEYAESEGLVQQATKDEAAKKKERTEAEESKAAAATRLADAQAKMSAAQLATNEAQSELNKAKTQLANLKEDYEGLQQTLRNLEESFPGITIDEVADKVAELEQSKIDLAKRLADTRANITGAEAAIKANAETIARTQAAIAERAQRIAANQAEPLITAVNSRWNFVVMTNTAELSPQDRLIVKRGTNYIGKVVVKDVEDGQVIADVVSDSLAPGVRIQAGDRAIREVALAN